MPELQIKVHNVVQEVVIKAISNKEECKEAMWLSEKSLQIGEKSKEVQGKEEKERYTQLNVEFQRIARRDKKAFLNEQ